MGSPTREQVRQAIVRAHHAEPYAWADPETMDAAADAVLALLAETPPKVLWEGETVGVRGPGWPKREGSSIVQVNLMTDSPPGTRVAVVLAEGTADHG